MAVFLGSFRYLCGQAAFSSSTNKGSSAVRLHQPSVASSCERPLAGFNEGRKPRALNSFTSLKVVERDGPPRRLSHLNAELHLSAPQRLAPQ